MEDHERNPRIVMKLGGWSRLGVVLSVFYGVLVGVFVFDTWPTKEPLERAWVREASGVMAQAISEESGQPVRSSDLERVLLGHMSASDRISFFRAVADTPTEAQKAFAGSIARVNERHKEAISRLPMARFRILALGFAAWLAGVCVLFLGGFAVRWVYDGFRGA
jgi:hypothetical protein